MIIVKLMGGLGNQMFQYAAGRALALRHGVELKLDHSFLEADAKGAYTPRRYELDEYNIQAQKASRAEIAKFIRIGESRTQRVLQRALPFLYTYCHAVESGSSYHGQFASYPKNTYLEGFWQSEKYFKPHEEQIRRDFTLSRPLPPGLSEITKQMGHCNSVSVHVRRGDYVTLSSAREFHGLLDMKYYEQAVKAIEKKFGRIEVFVFSDDPDWCRANFKWPEITLHFMEQQKNAAWDMRLMSACRHHVIANSSFSWWGAWLNADKEKMVVIPRNWFSDKTSESMDIVPPGWVVM